jgi:spore germination cell wall hydrolase CwlJ-like protein
METRDMTACEVVKESGQFSGFHRGMRLVATEEMLQRLKKVRRIAPVASSATFFHSDYVKPTWASKMKKILTIGRHTFFAERKHKEKKQ